MTVRADLIIVGAGLAGASAAYVAAHRGLNVVVLEAFGPAHRNGSSHGSARIFRRAYPDPLYVRLTGQSGRRWRALEDAAGERLLTLTTSSLPITAIHAATQCESIAACLLNPPRLHHLIMPLRSLQR